MCDCALPLSPCPSKEKSLFLLLHPTLNAELHPISTTPPHDKVHNFWTTIFQSRPSWKHMLDLARGRAHKELGEALRSKFE